MSIKDKLEKLKTDTFRNTLTDERNNVKAAARLTNQARAYAKAAKADNTRTAYRSDWASFERWCETHNLRALPAAPETVATYLAARAADGRKVSTIARGLAAIAQGHKAAGLPSLRGAAPVRAVMQGIRRTHGAAPTKKRPVLVDDLRRMLSATPDNVRGARDRAVLLLGFAGALRRSEIAALDVEDLDFGPDGLTVTLRRSKTDQEGQSRRVGVPRGADAATCPVEAVRGWLDAAGVAAGAAFRSVNRAGRAGRRMEPRTVASAVKRTARAAGLDASQLSGHSLRSGFATSAARAGKSERAIMAQTGHRSIAVLRGYIRHGTLFMDNAAAGIGL